MKQQDIAILIIIIFFAGIFSFVVSSNFITPSDQKEKVEKVQPISSEFSTQNAENINSDAINPTVRIEINPQDNAQPFNSSGR